MMTVTILMLSDCAAYTCISELGDDEPHIPFYLHMVCTILATVCYKSTHLAFIWDFTVSVSPDGLNENQ